jgi:hypothetical protein
VERLDNRPPRRRAIARPDSEGSLSQRHGETPPVRQQRGARRRRASGAAPNWPGLPAFLRRRVRAPRRHGTDPQTRYAVIRGRTPTPPEGEARPARRQTQVACASQPCKPSNPRVAGRSRRSTRFAPRRGTRCPHRRPTSTLTSLPLLRGVGTVDIEGFELERSAKFRDVATRVVLTVSDVPDAEAGAGSWSV